MADHVEVAAAAGLGTGDHVEHSLVISLGAPGLELEFFSLVLDVLAGEAELRKRATGGRH